MGKCKEPNCPNPPFNEYCRYHQFRLYMKGGRLYKSKPRLKSSMPKESSKRKEERVYYKDACKQLTEEIKAQNNGKIYCFFSGLEITGFPTYHHLRGRTGDYYIDKEWLVPAINQYHLDYHFMPMEKLMQQFWYKDFLTRLKKKNTQLYYKELKRQEKAELF